MIADYIASIGSGSGHFNMPGFKPDPQIIVLIIPEFYITQANQLPVDIGLGEPFGKIMNPVAFLSHIKIADTMKGIPRGGKGS